ncbi:hypothetical protein LT493_11960 [Streptomyces tricolor]|nr:hypothetical protein [Streptomyces tricolor]
MRFARDLHDLLGYSLSTITLKCELRLPADAGGRRPGPAGDLRGPRHLPAGARRRLVPSPTATGRCPCARRCAMPRPVLAVLGVQAKVNVAYRDAAGRGGHRTGHRVPRGADQHPAPQRGQAVRDRDRAPGRRGLVPAGQRRRGPRRVGSGLARGRQRHREPDLPRQTPRRSPHRRRRRQWLVRTAPGSAPERRRGDTDDRVRP